MLLYDAFDDIASFTIHTNIKSYGPFGDGKDKPFASEKGRIIGSHGRGGVFLDNLSCDHS